MRFSEYAGRAIAAIPQETLSALSVAGVLMRIKHHQ